MLDLPLKSSLQYFVRNSNQQSTFTFFFRIRHESIKAEPETDMPGWQCTRKSNPSLVPNLWTLFQKEPTPVPHSQRERAYRIVAVAPTRVETILNGAGSCCDKPTPACWLGDRVVLSALHLFRTVAATFVSNGCSTNRSRMPPECGCEWGTTDTMLGPWTRERTRDKVWRNASERESVQATGCRCRAAGLKDRTLMYLQPNGRLGRVGEQKSCDWISVLRMLWGWG